MTLRLRMAPNPLAVRKARLSIVTSRFARHPARCLRDGEGRIGRATGEVVLTSLTGGGWNGKKRDFNARQQAAVVFPQSDLDAMYCPGKLHAW